MKITLGLLLGFSRFQHVHRSYDCGLQGYEGIGRKQYNPIISSVVSYLWKVAIHLENIKKFASGYED